VLPEVLEVLRVELELAMRAVRMETLELAMLAVIMETLELELEMETLLPPHLNPPQSTHPLATPPPHPSLPKSQLSIPPQPAPMPALL
jgi:hypothetical protein